MPHAASLVALLVLLAAPAVHADGVVFDYTSYEEATGGKTDADATLAALTAWAEKAGVDVVIPIGYALYNAPSLDITPAVEKWARAGGKGPLVVQRKAAPLHVGVIDIERVFATLREGEKGTPAEIKDRLVPRVGKALDRLAEAGGYDIVLERRAVTPQYIGPGVDLTDDLIGLARGAADGGNGGPSTGRESRLRFVDRHELANAWGVSLLGMGSVLGPLFRQVALDDGAELVVPSSKFLFVRPALDVTSRIAGMGVFGERQKLKARLDGYQREEDFGLDQRSYARYPVTLRPNVCYAAVAVAIDADASFVLELEVKGPLETSELGASRGTHTVTLGAGDCLKIPDPMEEPGKLVLTRLSGTGPIAVEFLSKPSRPEPTPADPNQPPPAPRAD